MEKLTIPEASTILGKIDAIEHEGDIDIVNALVPKRLHSRKGNIRYHSRSDQAECTEINANGQLDIQGTALSIQQLHAAEATVNASECRLLQGVLTAGLSIEANEIILGTITASSACLKADTIKAERLVVTGELRLESNLSMVREIVAKSVVILGSLDCKRLVAEESVTVMSGSVAIKHLESPDFSAAPEVSGIVVVAICKEVKAQGVRGFLHPDELTLLADETKSASQHEDSSEAPSEVEQTLEMEQAPAQAVSLSSLSSSEPDTPSNSLDATITGNYLKEAAFLEGSIEGLGGYNTVPPQGQELNTVALDPETGNLVSQDSSDPQINDAMSKLIDKPDTKDSEVKLEIESDLNFEKATNRLASDRLDDLYGDGPTTENLDDELTNADHDYEITSADLDSDLDNDPSESNDGRPLAPLPGTIEEVGDPQALAGSEYSAEDFIDEISDSDEISVAELDDLTCTLNPDEDSYQNLDDSFEREVCSYENEVESDAAVDKLLEVSFENRSDLGGALAGGQQDPEDLAVIDLTAILNDVKAFFSEDNYPQFINQIMRYLEERRLSIFFRESNKKAVLASFDNFKHETISTLARSFFNRLEKYKSQIT